MDSEPENNLPSEMVYTPADEETLAVRDLLAGLDPVDLAICVSFLQQSVGHTSLDCRSPESLGDLEKRVSLPEVVKKRFVKILSRLVKGQEGLSRLEIAFIRQIWHEFWGDWEQTVGSPMRRSVT